MDMINFDGLLIGIATFLIIGLFHPVVVKAEYYWGTKCWWIFLVLGIKIKTSASITHAIEKFPRLVTNRITSSKKGVLKC